MLFQLVIVTAACLAFVNGQNVDTRTWSGGLDYWYSKKAYAEVASVEVDGKKIPQAPAGQHCFPPNDCWEVIKKDHISYVTGPLKGEKATITLELTTGKPITLLYKKTYDECPCETANIKADFVQEVTDCERILYAIIYDQPIKNVTIKGAISTGDEDRSVAKLAWQEDDRIFFTGHLLNRPRVMKINMKKGGTMYVTIAPQDAVANPKPKVSIIDKNGAIKSSK